MEPLRRFLEYSMESLGSILKAPRGQTLGQKLEGHKLPRGSIHHYIPKAFPQIVILKSNKQTNNIKKTVNAHCFNTH